MGGKTSKLKRLTSRETCFARVRSRVDAIDVIDLDTMKTTPISIYHANE